MEQPLDLLKVHLKYGELEADVEGSFDDVWKTINNFLREIKANLVSESKSVVITTAGKTVPEILIELRNVGFFDEPKSSKQCLNKLKELGKTDITPNAISMALKKLVERGELKRVSQGKSFLYIAPYVDFRGE